MRELEDRLLPGLRFWRAVALHRPTGAVVALSAELTRERSNPQGLVGQSDTIVPFPSTADTGWGC